MSPYVSYLMLFKIVPGLGKLAGLFVGAKKGLDWYYSRIEQQKKKPGKWAWATWCLGYYLPLVVAFVLAGWMFWSQASKGLAFAFYVDRVAGGMSGAAAVATFSGMVWIMFHPQPVRKHPRVRARSRGQLGY